MLQRKRILRSVQVAHIVRKGKTLISGPFIFKVDQIHNKALPSCWAIVVAKKYYKKAVSRNDIKRRIFRVIESIDTTVTEGSKIVVLMKGGVGVLADKEIKEFFQKFIQQVH